MNHVSDSLYWLGGSPCSGKSSIAALLSEQYNLATYNCDDHFDRHQSQASPQNQPALYQLGTMSWDEIWMRPVAEQVRHVIEVYREEFPMILADLRALTGERPILVEGAALLPDRVAPHLTGEQTAVYLIPTPQFQVETYARRDWIDAVLAQCEEPQQAFANWMARDVQFGRWVAETAAAHKFPVVHVDGSQTIAQNAACIANMTIQHLGRG